MRNKRSIPYLSWGESGLDHVLLNYHYVLFFIQFSARGTSASSNHGQGDVTSETQPFSQHRPWGYSLHKSYHKAYVYFEWIGHPFLWFLVLLYPAMGILTFQLNFLCFLLNSKVSKKQGRKRNGARGEDTLLWPLRTVSEISP